MSLLIVGFAAVLLLAVAVVVDASAAYLQRQGLDTLADGAALQGADLGSVGAYQQGVPDERLLQETSAVHAAVGEYLDRVGARARYPGLSHAVHVDTDAGLVRVRLTAPLDLPLAVPWLTEPPLVSASGAAAVTVQRRVTPDPSVAAGGWAHAAGRSGWAPGWSGPFAVWTRSRPGCSTGGWVPTG
ncbi:pilus assembly protein TadG-related protein [Nocardioides solisilvae]|uniref:pilus assembly protein TadG-related protein n=1 Tax=Nocardioides solisilvae TaxID=1542435 RepID=UPI001EF411EB|nr:pilus assembly protein TadG-related protein [Nocardioides solisilvae]